jgi:transketolase
VQGQGYIGQALGYADVLATAFAHGMSIKPD